MGARDAHLGQAKANRQIAGGLASRRDGREPPAPAVQWAVTAAFYCSVHCIEAHLATRGHHSLSHEDRYDKMSWVGVPDDVYTSHEQLQQWSEQARYLLRRFSIEFYEQNVLRYLKVVTDYVGLGEDASTGGG